MEYRPLTDRDIPLITKLYAQWLNGGQIIGDDIRDAWKRDAYFGSIAWIEDRVAGIFTMREGLQFTYPHPDLEAELRALAGEQKIYTSDALLVLPEFRTEGIAHHLIRHTIEQLRRRTPGLVMTEIWIYPDGRCPAREPLETIGTLIYRRRVPLFYKDLSRYGITCPICGTRCVCGAWVELAEVRREGDLQ